MNARAAVLYAAGLGLGTANAVRHKVRGYRTPRPFGAENPGHSVDYCFQVVERWERRGGVDFTGRNVLELGPGPDLGTGAIVLSRGATSYVAADRFGLATKAPPGFYQVMESRLGCSVDVGSLRFVVTSFPEMPEITGQFDLIVSNAALEHFDDVGGTFRRLAQLCAPGAVMCHHVDAKAHMRFIRDVDPLNMHRYSEGVYRRLLSFPGAPNRLFASDYITLAQNAGFECRVVPGRRAPTQYVADFRKATGTRLMGRPTNDLELLSFTLMAARR